MSNSRRETAVDPHVSPSVDRRVTRSMSNSRRETTVDPRAVDLPPRKVPRLMSKGRRETTVDPRAVDLPARKVPRRETTVDRRIINRPKAPKWKQPLMSLPDLSRPFSPCPKRSAMLKKQFERVMDNIKNSKGDGPVVLDFSNVRDHQLCRKRHTLETQQEALNIIGIKVPILGGKTPEQEAEVAWHRTCADVVRLVTRNITLPQRDLICLFEVSRRIYNTLASADSSPLWKCLDFRGMNNVGDRLAKALSMPRYHHVVEDINLEFADIEDKHLKLLKTECGSSVGFLESLNLSGCQKISNRGVKDITSICPRLKRFSIQGNSKVTDLSMKYLANNCKFLTNLNLRCCEKITDRGLEALSKMHSDSLTTLDVNGCIGIEDGSKADLLLLFPNLRCFSSCYLLD